MTILATILALLKVLPQVLDLLTHIGQQIGQGVDLLQLLAMYKRIDKGFLETDTAKKAKELNDVFRKN